MRGGSIWTTVHKFSPIALIIGYLVFYQTQKPTGIAQIPADLAAFPGQVVTRLQAASMNAILAVVAAGALYFVHKMKLPAAIKAIVVIVLLAFIGWQLADVIDPPAGMPQSSTPTAVKYVQPHYINQYSLMAAQGT